METALQKLAKVLELERQAGYRNRAVIGGIQRYIPVWIEEARDQADTEIDKVLVEQIGELLMDYGDLAGPNPRAKLIESIQERLKKVQAAPVAVVEAETPPPDAPEEEQPAETPETVTGVGEAPAEAPAEKPAEELQRVDVDRPQPPRPVTAVKPKPDLRKKRATPAGLSAPITSLRGIGPRTAQLFEKLGLDTIRDALYFFPRRYVDYSLLKPINRLEYGEQVTVIGTVWETRVHEMRGRKKRVQSIIGDGTATVACNWFNQPWLANNLRAGATVMISGQVDQYLGRLTFSSPEWELVEKEQLHTGRIVPIYALTAGLTAKAMRTYVKRVVDYWALRTPDPLPDEIRQPRGLIDLETALLQIHYPDDWDRLAQARRRLAFDELLALQLGLLRMRHEWQSEPGVALEVTDDRLSEFLGQLPFALTGAQQQALQDVRRDMASAIPMNRLLQGDVGSGKTVVAAAAVAAAVAAGAQAALMAPTEILAEQHATTMGRMLGDARVRLLTGSLPAAEKQQVYDEMAQGEVDVVIGTHALIQVGVNFRQLGLVIVDEQHRFGVEQRSTLRQKGHNPHVLIMTATPIPRTLALTLYGDLDITLIDEMPPGRQAVETRWLEPRTRERAYNFIRGQAEKGRQAFIICPLVEESDKSEAKAATQEYRRLQKQVFPDLKLGILHGRMKSEAKEAAMTAFYRGETQVLVSTSVVEVGIDVPNATVMLIEGANRFGLAQLHQFRGRVGRGAHQSYCLLLADSATPEAQERLAAVEATNDGFELAEKDLELRGPGEFFGTRQSGLPDLKLADVTDIKSLAQARDAALAIAERDPMLDEPDHRLLARMVDRFWSGRGDAS